MKRLLAPGERVLLQTRQHTVVLVRPLARSLVLVAIGVTAGIVLAPRVWPLAAAGLALAAAGAVVALAAVAAWDRTTIVLTSRRALVAHGVLRRRIADLELAPGAPLELERPLAGRLLGYGTLVAGDFAIPYVPDPDRVLSAS